MFVPTSTMIAIFMLLAFLSGVVIWLVIVAGRMSNQILALHECNQNIVDDLNACEKVASQARGAVDALATASAETSFYIKDLYEQMTTPMPDYVAHLEQLDDLEVPDTAHAA
ncbi:hypothetical protein FRC0418_00617 [Corynebacterium diphtheriae]|nr:hypothetical protein FRC0326_00664 [Corynebacterium diphtheriae]CAB0854435.1 hypothetical protein FRC0378_00709 [Corynebacterium diphtheriae]CAB0895650.1 hypothetical protein FRC0418_00617 [Corynebacterium diphtheriae]CAB0942439.1 hypothetical protein FRC0448_00590 [Corynebacterium diphtheriae]